MRIVIAEDSAVVRAGLVEILADSGHEVVAAVGTGDDLLAAVDEHHPDAAVVDVRMPPGYTDEGLRAAIAIRRDHPKTGVLVFSQYIETRYAADLLGAASGWCSSTAASRSPAVPTAATTSWPLSARISTRPARITAESSAITIRNGSSGSVRRGTAARW